MRDFSGLVLDTQQKDRAMAKLDIEATQLRDKVRLRAINSKQAGFSQKSGVRPSVPPRICYTHLLTFGRKQD